MEKGKNTPPEDITKQHYKGPSQAVAMLGEGAMQTKFLMLSGLVAGGAAALIAPKQSAEIFGSIRNHINKAVASENGFLKLAGTFGKFTLDIGKETADLIQKIGFVKDGMSRFNKGRLEQVIDGAIITSGGASIIGAFSGGGAGIASARAGRKQFDTAKEHILDMRQKLAQKQKEVDDLKTQIEDLKVQQAAGKGLLKVSGDAEHPIASDDMQQTDNATEPAAKNWRETVSTKEASAEQAADTEDKAALLLKDAAAKNVDEAPAKSHTESLGDKPAADWKQDIAEKQAAKTDEQLAL